jgi:hypothetical protein
VAGQGKQAGGAQPPHTPEDEADATLLALLGRLVTVSASGAVEARRLPAAAVNRLLALLVEQQMPAGLRVTTEEEFERARERAYADGWQDALCHLRRHTPQDAVGEGAIPVQSDPAERGAQEQPARDAADSVQDSGGNQATVLVFPPRIPLVRAADASRRDELMPHRPRPRRRGRPKSTPEQPKNG